LYSYSPWVFRPAHLRHRARLNPSRVLRLRRLSRIRKSERRWPIWGKLGNT